MKSPFRGRTRLEQLLVVLLVLMFVCLLGVAIALGIRSRDGWTSCSKQEVCVTRNCLLAASDFLSSRDASVDPCEDFYDYVCRKWMNDTIFTDDNRDKFASLDDDLNRKLKDLLEANTPKDLLPKHFLKAQQFYQACMNTTEREENAMTHFLADLEMFGEFPALKGDSWSESNFSYPESLLKIWGSGFDEGIFFTIGVELDYKNNSLERIVISQSALGMSRAEYFQREDLVENYSAFLTRTGYYICQHLEPPCTFKDAEKIGKEIRQAVDVEIHLASIMVPPKDVEKKELSYNIMNVTMLQDISPGVDWLSLLRVLTSNATESDEVMVAVPEFLRKVSSYITELNSTAEGRRKMANYIMYRVTKEVSKNVDRKIRGFYYDYLNAMTGEEEVPSQWKDCLSSTKAVFDYSLSAMYVKKYFPKERKAAMENMIEGIRAELKDILMKTPWMDDSTRGHALRKLDMIHCIAAYPEDILDEDKLNKWFQEFDVGTDHYENIKKGNIFLNMKAIEGYGTVSDRTSWKHLPGPLLEANALYYPNNNSIFVPLGIAQDWFFEENNPKYVNYGRIGFVIAHEFGHAFDSEGADLDELGNWRNWWRNDTLQQFRQSSKCMVDLFDGYFMPQANLSLNGSLTLTENIADDVGLAEVYRAYTSASFHEPDYPLPGVNLSPNQLFWVNVAAVWCEKQTDEHYEALITNDEHSPAKFRVISPLSNNVDFSRDFGCKMGSKMNEKASKCHVWGI